MCAIFLAIRIQSFIFKKKSGWKRCDKHHGSRNPRHYLQQMAVSKKSFGGTNICCVFLLLENLLNAMFFHFFPVVCSIRVADIIDIVLRTSSYKRENIVFCIVLVLDRLFAFGVWQSAFVLKVSNILTYNLTLLSPGGTLFSLFWFHLSSTDYFYWQFYLPIYFSNATNPVVIV